MEKNGLLVTDSRDKRDTFLALSPRMRHLRFAALIAVLSGSLSASGQTQLGYVKTKGRLNFNGSVTAGQKLSGAVVTVLNGNNVMSDDDGKFSLKLSSPQFVLKSVTKKNYVLCDPDLLKKQYSYSTNDFVIVMEDELEKANERKKIERKVRNSLYAQTEKEREEIDRLKQENAITEEKYRELLLQVNKKEDDNETIIKDMVKKYSQIDFDQEDDFSRQFSLFLLNGETMQADSLLRTKGNIADDLNKFKAFRDATAQKRAEQAVRDSLEHRSRRELADRCYKYFGLLQTQHKNDSAAFYIEQRANLDTLNADWQFDAGNYFQDQNQFKQTELYLVRALEIRRELARSNPQAYEPALAQSLNNLANLYGRIRRYEEAEAMINEALAIRKRLAKDNPQAYDPDVAGSLSSLAVLYFETRQLDKAEATHKEALEIRKRLAKANPKEYEPSVVFTKPNFANLYTVTQQFDKAETMNKQALDIRTRLAKDNPQTYEEDVAQSMINLAVLYSDTERLEEAETLFKNALEILRRLAKDNPQAYEPELGIVLNDLATVYCQTARWEEAEQTLGEALEIRRRLAKANPQAYELEVVSVLYNMGGVYLETQRAEKAKPLFREVLEVFERLAKNNPKRYEKYIKDIKAILEN